VAEAGNAAAFFVVLLSAGELAWMASGSTAAACLAQSLLITSRPLLRSMATVQTEPWFLALIAAGTWCAASYVVGGRRALLLPACIAFGLAALQRYVGAVFVLGVGAFLLRRPRGAVDTPWRARLGRGASFAGAALAPLAIWMLRNLLVAGAPSGQRDPSDVGYAENASRALATVSDWFVPDGWPSAGWLAPGRWAWLLLVAASCSVAVVRSRRSPRGAVISLVAVLAVLYPAFMITYGSHLHLDPLGHRLMLPLLPFLAVLAVAGVAPPPGGTRSARAWRIGGMVLLAAVALAKAPRAAGLMAEARNHGLGGLESQEWRDSPLVPILEELTFSGPVYSNLPELVSYHTGVATHPLPSRGLRQALRESALAAEPGHVVWVARDGIPTMNAGRVLEMTEVARCADGVVYRTSPRD
jgi:hypothetical protein